MTQEPAHEEQIWAQDSHVKGLRVVRFRVVPERSGALQWIGEVGEHGEPSFVYGEKELIKCGWVRVE